MKLASFQFTLIFFICITSIASPEISVIGSGEVQLGDYSAKERKEVLFHIKNCGDETLEIINLRKSCVCAEVRVDRNRLAPGQRAKITAIVLANSIFTPYDIKIYVESNDPKSKLVILKIKGNPLPLFKVTPTDKIYVKRILKGDTLINRFSLKALQAGVELKEPVIESNYPVKLIKIDSALNNLDLIEYEYHIHIEKVIGDLRCNIKFPVVKPKGWGTLNLLIFGRVGNSFTAIPNRIMLSREKQIVNKPFVLRLLAPGEVDIDKIKWTPPKGVEGINFKLKKLDAKTVKVNATYNNAFLVSLRDKKKIVIKFEYPDAQPAIIIIK